MKVGIIGSGEVGRTLASGFLKHGHEVMMGTRDAGKLADWAKENPKGKVGTFPQTAKFGEVVVVAVKGDVVADALKQAGKENLAGKVVIDANNPIADEPPVNGVLKFYTQTNDSLMERLQKEFSGAKFVKAFNSVGADLMVNPKFKEGRPTMFICGNDEGAKKTVAGICEQFGWDVADMGKVEAARAIEPLCLLWCIPGFLRDEWSHAFKLLRS